TDNTNTLNSFDNVDGAAGHNTLNVLVVDTGVEEISVPIGASIRNFQTVNVLNTVAASVDVSGFEGAEAIWQIGGAGNVSGITTGQTAGFRDVAAIEGVHAIEVSADEAATEVSIALDGAGQAEDG